MIKIYISSEKDSYVSYCFETFKSMWHFLMSLDFPLYNLHFVNKVDGKTYFYDLSFRLSVVDCVNYNFYLRQYKEPSKFCKFYLK